MAGPRIDLERPAERAQQVALVADPERAMPPPAPVSEPWTDTLPLTASVATIGSGRRSGSPPATTMRR